MGPSVVENVVVDFSPFLVVVVLLVVLTGGLMVLTKPGCGLSLQKVTESVSVVRLAPPAVLDGLKESTSGSFIVTLVDLSSVVEVIVVKALLIELRVVVERLVVSVDLDVVFKVDVDVDVDLDLDGDGDGDGDGDVDVDVRVGRLVVTRLAVELEN